MSKIRTRRFCSTQCSNKASALLRERRLIERGWNVVLRLNDWITLDRNVIDFINIRCKEMRIREIRSSLCFVYIDRRISDNTEFYVGKGDISRVRGVEGRNDYHANIVAKHGIVRKIEYVCFDDAEIMLKEIELIKHYNTYHYKNSRGANLTLGGDGARGAIRPIEARQKASTPVNQLTIEGEFIKRFASIKIARQEVPGANVILCCQGKLLSSKGFRWEYASDAKPRKRTDKTRKNISASSYKRPVQQFDHMGNLIETFDQIRTASEKTGVGTDNIRRAVYTSGSTAGGFVWRYVDEPERSLQPAPRNKHPVMQMTMSGNCIAVFASMNEASQQTGVFAANISGCCCGTRRHARGFRWKCITMDEYLKIKHT